MSSSSSSSVVVDIHLKVNGLHHQQLQSFKPLTLSGPSSLHANPHDNRSDGTSSLDGSRTDAGCRNRGSTMVGTSSAEGKSPGMVTLGLQSATGAEFESMFFPPPSKISLLDIDDPLNHTAHPVIDVQNKSVFHVVLTGGPCAGKSTLLSALQSTFQAKTGVKVFTVPEAATLLVNGGLEWTNMTHEKVIEYQLALLRVQLSLENNILKIAAHCGQPALVVSDRGTMDGRAYCSEEQFQEILRRGKYTLETLQARYDAVIHMTTAAIGAEKFYNFDNIARFETVEEAKKTDERLRQMYVGHSRLKVFDNISSKSFSGKLDRVFDFVCEVVGAKARPHHRTRRYLMTTLPQEEDIPVKCVRVKVTVTLLSHSTPDDQKMLLRREHGTDRVFIYINIKSGASVGGGYSPGSSIAGLPPSMAGSVNGNPSTTPATSSTTLPAEQQLQTPKLQLDGSPITGSPLVETNVIQGIGANDPVLSPIDSACDSGSSSPTNPSSQGASSQGNEKGLAGSYSSVNLTVESGAGSGGGNGIKTEHRITAQEYQNLMVQRDQNREPIIKENLSFMHGDYYYEVGAFLSPERYKGMAIMYVDCEATHQIPNFLKIDKDVTGDLNYSSYVMSRKNGATGIVRGGGRSPSSGSSPSKTEEKAALVAATSSSSSTANTSKSTAK